MCFNFCNLEQIIATVLFIYISSINNKRSLLRFQSITPPTKRGWSACAVTFCYPVLPSYPLLPCLTLRYPLLPCVTLRYPSLPFVTLCDPVLPSVPLCFSDNSDNSDNTDNSDKTDKTHNRDNSGKCEQQRQK